MNRWRRRVPRGEGGFSYVEVLVATLLIAVSLVPVMQSLQVGVLGPYVGKEQLEVSLALRSRMEEVLADPFSALDTEALAVGSHTAATSYSDPGGTPNRRLVYLSRYDGDNADGDDDTFTGTDSGLVWVRIEVEGTGYALESLTSVY